MSASMSLLMSNRKVQRSTRAAIDVAVDPDGLPVRIVRGTFFRHTAPSRDALDVPPRALATGRYHRKRQEPRLYASSSEDAAWGELFRHTEPEISPFEVRRTMSTLRVVDLPVLDLTDPVVRSTLGVTERNLTSARYADCRRIADIARQVPHRFGGILAPSAAAPGAETLVVFRESQVPGRGVGARAHVRR